MTREERSIKLIKSFEPKKGYMVGNSGGKDSIVLDHLMKRAGVKFTSIFNFTTVDPIPVRRFLRKNYPDTIWLYPKETMFQGILKRDLPRRNARWCCEHLKHYANKWEVVATGIRKDESTNRAKNRCEMEFFDNHLMFNPIFKWSTRQIWEYIRKHNLPYCELYDKGFNRIGCIGCPMTGYKNLVKEFNMFPNYKKAYIWSIQKLIDKGLYSDFDNAEDVFEWWIRGIKTEKFFGMKKQMKFIF
ncbi:phosphoadenosine phosphosulfate reductase family protein [Candidatus Dependentiae bacterium]|nr:phosphoadenosine phosphosulfate reductase family protein [Candidatus Dependentiae bacterium]